MGGGRYNLSIIEADATSPSKPPISSSQVSVLHIIHLFQHPPEISKKIFPKEDQRWAIEAELGRSEFAGECAADFSGRR